MTFHNQSNDIESNFYQLRELFRDYDSRNLENPEDGLLSIRDKLFTILCSPMKDSFSLEAFKWICQLTLATNGFAWISPNSKWSDEKEIRIFLCVTRLSLTEIQLLLPLLKRHITYGDEPEIDQGKVVARSANSQDYDKFGNHLIMLEHVIQTLVQGEEYEDMGDNKANRLTKEMKKDDLRNLLRHLKETLSMIVDYLEVGDSSWSSLNHDYEDEKFSSVVGSLKLVSTWLADDPCGFQDECKRFLIGLLIKHLLLDNCQRDDIFIVALHSVCMQDQMIDSLKGLTGFEDALQGYLDQVNKDQNDDPMISSHKRRSKIYKLRCGLVRDLLDAVDHKS